MATIDSKKIVDGIIEHGGRQYPDEPPVTRIVEYTNVYGNTTWGVTWEGEDINRYVVPSEYVRNPKIIWEQPGPKQVVVYNRLGLRYILQSDPAGPQTMVHLLSKLEDPKMLVFPLEFQEMCARWGRWQQGAPIQRVFGDLSPDLREFLMTGITPKEWEAMPEEE